MAPWACVRRALKTSWAGDLRGPCPNGRHVFAVPARPLAVPHCPPVAILLRVSPPSPNHSCNARPRRCLTSGTTHVCDSNCNQRVPYGNGSEVICRVSRKVSPAPGWVRPAGLGKRAREEDWVVAQETGAASRPAPQAAFGAAAMPGLGVV